MKNNFLKQIIVMCLITSLFSTCVLAQNLSTESQSIEKDSVSIENEVVVKKNKINDVSIIKKEKQEKLKELGFDIDKVEYMEDIKSNEDQTTYKKLVKDENEYVCVDENNEVFEISNFKTEEKQENKSSNKILALFGTSSTTNESKDISKQDIKNITDKIIEYCNLENDYELVESESFDDDYWNVNLMRRLENGVLNPYESVKATINKEDLTIVSLHRFNEKAESVQAKVKEEEAKKIALDFIKSSEGIEDVVDKISLTYVHPNNFWKEEDELEEEKTINLAYEVIVDGFTVYVDALTGEVIGGDQFQDNAGCYGQTNKYYYQGTTDVNLAVNGMIKLGYKPAYNLKSDYSKNLRPTVLRHVQNRSGAYGFYFRGHGSPSNTNPFLAVIRKINGEKIQETILKKSEVKGNWHFVFLDACSTGRTIWSYAFNIHNGHKNRAFLGWFTTVNTGESHKFNKIFWTLIGTRSIRNAAVAAANGVPGNGTTPIRFYGDPTYYGKAWK